MTSSSRCHFVSKFYFIYFFENDTLNVVVHLPFSSASKKKVLIKILINILIETFINFVLNKKTLSTFFSKPIFV